MSEPRTWPVVELFGPTIQGEGPVQGSRCWFLRLGGCDYRCTWCDSMMAVDPAQVREAPRMNAQEIELALVASGLRGGSVALRTQGGQLILSGGNPALHHLDELLDYLYRRLPGVQVHVETQATMWRDWLNRCQLLVCSPKPPSAWPAQDDSTAQAARARQGVEVARNFLRKAVTNWALKLVVFDEQDLSWAGWAHLQLGGGHGYQGTWLSAGTDQQAGDLSGAVVERYRWLTNAVLERPQLASVRVGLQAHQLVWPGELAR